jgi:hypothetical protein
LALPSLETLCRLLMQRSLLHRWCGAQSHEMPMSANQSFLLKKLRNYSWIAESNAYADERLLELRVPRLERI